MSRPSTPPPIVIDDGALSIPPDTPTTSDLKAGRKREREPSTEPTQVDPVAPTVNERGSSSRIKKNKTLLDVASDDESSPPRSSASSVGPASPLSPKSSKNRKRAKDRKSWAKNPTLKPEHTTNISPADNNGEQEPGDISIEEVEGSGSSDESPSEEATELSPEAKEVVAEGAPQDSAVADIPALLPTAEAVVSNDSEPGPSTPPPETVTATATPPDAEAETEADAVAPLPSVPSDEAIPRTDRALKRKSRDSVFFAAGEPAVESHKRQKDDLEAKAATSDTALPKPKSPTPPPSRSPNKFNGFAAFSSRPSPFLTVGAGSKSFLDAQTPSKLAPSTAPASPFRASVFSKFPSPKPTPTGSSSDAPKGTFGLSAGGYTGFANRTSSFPTAGTSTTTTTTLSGPGTGTTSISSSSHVFGSSSGPKGSVPKSNEAFGSYSGITARFGAFAKAKSPPSGANGDVSDGKEEDTSSEPEKKASFSDILAGGGDDNSTASDTAKPVIEAVELTTGEEDETTLHSLRAKLYTMDSNDTYKERGTGQLKVNVRKSDGLGARVLMRADGVHRLLMNARLFPGMQCSIGQDPKYIKLATIEDGVFAHHAIRVGNPKAAQAFVELVLENIPEGGAAPPTPNEEV